MKLKLALVASMVMGLLAFGGTAALAWHPMWSECDGPDTTATASWAGWAGTIKQGSTVIGTLARSGDVVHLPTLNVEYQYWASNGERPGRDDKFTPTKDCSVQYSPTHAASFGCDGTTTRLTLDLAGYKDGSTVKVVVDGGTKFSTTFGGDLSKAWTSFNRYRSHTAVITVESASDKGDWDETLHARACKERIVYKPKARFSGPYCDPMYIVTFDNRDSDRAVRFVWYRTSHGVARKLERTVAAGKTWRSPMKHVDGRTITKVRAKSKVIASIRAAKGGDYPAPRGSHC